MVTSNKDLLVLASVTLITVFAWIGFEAYRSITNKPLPPQSQQVMAPLNPTIREDVLQQLEQNQP